MRPDSMCQENCMHNPAVRQGLGLQESQAISSGIPSLRHSCFRRGGSPEIFVYPDILGHFSYSGRVPVDSRGRRVGSEKVFRDYLRDALSGLARENCRRDVLMQYPCCHSPRQGGKGKTGRPAQDNRRFINAVFWILRTGAPSGEHPPLPLRSGLFNSHSPVIFLYDAISRDFPLVLYQSRDVDLVENGFLEFKQWRGVATRYAKNLSARFGP